MEDYHYIWQCSLISRFWKNINISFALNSSSLSGFRRSLLEWHIEGISYGTPQCFTKGHRHISSLEMIIGDKPPDKLSTYREKTSFVISK